MGEACAALARGLPLPDRLADFGLSAAMLSPAGLALRPCTAASGSGTQPQSAASEVSIRAPS